VVHPFTSFQPSFPYKQLVNSRPRRRWWFQTVRKDLEERNMLPVGLKPGSLLSSVPRRWAAVPNIKKRKRKKDSSIYTSWRWAADSFYFIVFCNRCSRIVSTQASRNLWVVTSRDMSWKVTGLGSRKCQSPSNSSQRHKDSLIKDQLLILYYSRDTECAAAGPWERESYCLLLCTAGHFFLTFWPAITRQQGTIQTWRKR
jgi:hypothetical protein